MISPQEWQATSWKIVERRLGPRADLPAILVAALEHLIDGLGSQVFGTMLSADEAWRSFDRALHEARDDVQKLTRLTLVDILQKQPSTKSAPPPRAEAMGEMAGSDELAALRSLPEPAPAARVVKRKSTRAKPAAATKPQPAVEEETRSVSEDRMLFPDLDCPGAVVAGQEFALRVGISSDPNDEVIGDGFAVPAGTPRSFVLSIQVVANGFSVRPGQSLRHSLLVSPKSPFPNVTIHLTADAQKENVRPAAVRAIYSIAAQTIGMAVRPISVVRSPNLLGEHEQAAPDVVRRDMAVPVGTSATDITVRLTKAEGKAGGLSWAIETRFEDIAIPDQAPTTDIGTSPQDFSRQLMLGVNDRQQDADALELYLAGMGRTIRDKMPPQFWEIFESVAEQTKAPPTILILSEDPYVPWELAFVDGRLPDEKSVPFLGAQATIGRWPLGEKKVLPPEGIKVAEAAIVWGKYDTPGWRRLQSAEEEAAELLGRFHGAAQSVNADKRSILACLRGNPAVDLMHFAVHGNFDAGGFGDGIVTLDGKTVDPMEVKGAKLARAPLVFLNACQLSQGRAVLGSYGGMAEAFLAAGASGVVAPLWSIDDTKAKEAALAFYGTADHTRPAQALREGRNADRAATLVLGLAYQFFGHPRFLLQLPPKT